MEDAGKYKVTAKNELGESNATISLNFDSKYRRRKLIQALCVWQSGGLSHSTQSGLQFPPMFPCESEPRSFLNRIIRDVDDGS